MFKPILSATLLVENLQVPSYASQQLRATVSKEPLPTADSPPWLLETERFQTSIMANSSLNTVSGPSGL